jgi:hypothetical protein
VFLWRKNKKQAFFVPQYSHQQRKRRNDMDSSIYTSNGTLVVQQTIWSGVRRLVKSADGSFTSFYRTHAQPKFRKTGWGKRAERDFHIALAEVKKEIYN